MKISSDFKAVEDARDTCNPNRRQREPELMSKPNGIDGQGNSRTHYLIENRCRPSDTSIFFIELCKKTRDKETSLFKKPQGFRTVRIHFTAIEWLGGTTKDDDGNTIGNHTLYDLLSRMRLAPAGAIHSAAGIAPGQFQFFGNQTRGGMEHREC